MLQPPTQPLQLEYEASYYIYQLSRLKQVEADLEVMGIKHKNPCHIRQVETLKAFQDICAFEQKLIKKQLTQDSQPAAKKEPQLPVFVNQPKPKPEPIFKLENQLNRLLFSQRQLEKLLHLAARAPRAWDQNLIDRTRSELARKHREIDNLVLCSHRVAYELGYISQVVRRNNWFEIKLTIRS